MCCRAVHRTSSAVATQHLQINQTPAGDKSSGYSVGYGHLAVAPNEDTVYKGRSRPQSNFQQWTESQVGGRCSVFAGVKRDR